MSTTLVIVLRAASLVGLAALLLLPAAGRRRRRHSRPDPRRGDRAPLLANLAAFGVFLPSLVTFAGTSEGDAALLLAWTGCLLALAGAALVFWARRELGSAWSLVPAADEATGLVTTGPYRRVRHPIYLGLSTLAMGEALAFASWPAFLVVVAGILPTFVWRASAEEKLLSAAFAERYARYRKQTRIGRPPE
jgi:protein-S-isoprenylcysteine O-methyltransferase Ste14